MRNKKRTDDEVKKALECHSQNDTCAGCVYWDGKLACTIALAKDTLDLIKRLQAENERLKNAYKQCAWERDAYIEIENTAIAEAKAEAYKEFAEKFENRILSMLTTATLDEKEIICAFVGINNNVLKELVGDDNAK